MLNYQNLILIYVRQIYQRMDNLQVQPKELKYIIKQQYDPEVNSIHEDEHEGEEVYWIFFIDNLIQHQSKQISSLYNRKISRHQPIVNNLNDLIKMLKNIQERDSSSIIKIVTNKEFCDKMCMEISRQKSVIAELLINLKSLYLYIPNFQVGKKLKKDYFQKLRQKIPTWKDSPIIIYQIKQGIRLFIQQMKAIRKQKSIFQNCYSLGDKSSTEKIQRYRARIYFCTHLKLDNIQQIQKYKSLFKKQINESKSQNSYIMRKYVIKTFQQICNKKLTADNKFAKQILQLYTKQSPFYSIINNGLRQFSEQHFQWQNYVLPIYLLFHAIKLQCKINPMSKTITLWRGGVLQEGQFALKQQSMSKLQFYQFTSFISTSLDKRIACNFLQRTIELKNACLFKFVVKQYQLISLYNLPFSGITYANMINQTNKSQNQAQIILNLLTIGRIINCRQAPIAQLRDLLTPQFLSNSKFISTIFQITIQVGHFQQLLDYYFTKKEQKQQQQRQQLMKTQAHLNQKGLSLTQINSISMTENKELLKTNVALKYKSKEIINQNINYSYEYILKMNLRKSLQYYKGTVIEYLQMMEVYKETVEYNIEDAYILSREYGKAIKYIEDKVSQINQLKQTSHKYFLLTKLFLKKSNIFRKQGYLIDSHKSYNKTLQLDEKFKQLSHQQSIIMDNKMMRQINQRAKLQYIDFLIESKRCHEAISELVENINKLQEQKIQFPQRIYKNQYEISLICYIIGLHYYRISNQKQTNNYLQQYAKKTLDLKKVLQQQKQKIQSQQIPLFDYLSNLLNNFFDLTTQLKPLRSYFEKHQRKNRIARLLFFLQGEKGWSDFQKKSEEVEQGIEIIFQKAKNDEKNMFTKDQQGKKKRRNSQQVKKLCKNDVNTSNQFNITSEFMLEKQKDLPSKINEALNDTRQGRKFDDLLMVFSNLISKGQNSKTDIRAIIQQQKKIKQVITSICELMLKTLPNQTIYYNYFWQKKTMVETLLVKQQRNRQFLIPMMGSDNQQILHQYLDQNQKNIEEYADQLQKQGFFDTSIKTFGYIMGIVEISLVLKNIGQIQKAQKRLKGVYLNSQQYKIDHQNYHNYNISFTNLYKAKISQIKSQCIFPNIHQKRIHLQSFYYKPSKSFEKTVNQFFQTKIQTLATSFGFLQKCHKYLNFYRESNQKRIEKYLQNTHKPLIKNSQTSISNIQDSFINIQLNQINQISKTLNSTDPHLKTQGWKAQQYQLIAFLKIQSSQSKFRLNKFIDMIYLTPIRIKIDIIELKISGIIPLNKSSPQFIKFYKTEVKQMLVSIQEQIYQCEKIIGYFQSEILVKEESSLKESLGILRLLQGRRNESIENINKTISIRNKNLSEGGFRLNQKNGQTLARSVILLKGQNQAIPLSWIKKIVDYYNLYHSHRLYWIICLSFFISHCQQKNLQTQFKSLQCLNSSMATLQRNNFYQDIVLYKIYDYQLYEKLYLPYIAKIKQIKNDKRLKQRERKKFQQYQ